MSVIDTIETQMKTAQDQADKALTVALDISTALAVGLNESQRLPSIGYHYINATIPDASVDPTDKPGGLQITGVVDSLFELPEYTVTVPEQLQPATFYKFDAIAPAVDLPVKPDALTAISPIKPIIRMPMIDEPPDYSLPEAPNLDTIVIPETPDFPVVDPFNETLPDPLEAAAIPTLVYNEETYQSDLLDAAKVWFIDQIANGGTGLRPEVAQAIFDRAATRMTETARDNIEKAADTFAGSGFPRPSGSLRATQEDIRNDLQNRVDDLNRDIMTEQAKLAQANTHFAIDKSLQYETMMLQHSNSVADRSFELAKATVTMAIEAFNARVSEYNSRLEAYKSVASVYEIVVRASAIEVDKYKATLEAKRVESGIQADEVEKYKIQVDAVVAVSRFYEVQLQASKIEADIEAMKLEAFRSEVSAYTAEIQAKEAEWNGYRAAIDGEKTKVDLYQSQINAYRAEIDAETAIITTHKINLDSNIELEELKLSQVKSQLATYSVDIEKQLKTIEGQVSAYLAKNEGYRSEIDRAKAQAIVNVEVAKISQDGHKFNAAVSNSRYHEQANLLSEQVKATIAGAAQGSNSASNAAAAALSQVTTIAQILGEEAI